MKVYLREHDGQGYTREASACAEVHDARARLEVDYLGNSQRVQDMMLVEIVYVLTGNHVDFGIPIPIEGIECGKALALLIRYVWEVFVDEFHDSCQLVFRYCFSES